MTEKFIVHFGVKTQNKNLLINRDNYATIDKKVHFKKPQFIIDMYKDDPEKRKKTYDNEELTIYSDSWCLKHQEYCLKNYDYNMSFFEKLEEKEFNKHLKKLIKYSRKIKEVKNLNDYSGVAGVYILVLDKYKQVYIGQTNTCIKTRIMSHWRKVKEFDRLLFGPVESSILSIDSFGALDTTRIFVYPTYNTYKLESELVELMNPDYLLNRTSGGIGSVDTYTDDKATAMVAVAAGRKKRNFEI